MASSMAAESDKSDLVLRALAEGEEDQWLDLLAEAFAAKGVPRDFFQQHARNDPHWNRDGVRVCCDGPSLVSTARVYGRKLQVLGEDGRVVAVPVGAIGDVATAPSHRRRGIAGRVLADAHSYMESIQCEIAMLHTSRSSLAKYYTGKGYVSIPIQSLVFDLATTEILATGDFSSEVVPSFASHPDDLSSIVHQHESTTKSLTGCFARTPDYWQLWVSHVVAWDKEWTLRIVRDRKKACVGYGVSRDVGGMLCVSEFCCLAKSDKERRHCFLCYLADELATRDPNPSRLRIMTPTVDPMWLTGIVVEDGSVVVGPVKEGVTLNCIGKHKSGAQIWHDEGQMFRLSGSFSDMSPERLFGDLVQQFTFFGVDSF
eukprot:m.277314 g.277314  ORF g.277314 m.277314 type:complete len:372 (-) comp16146_c0_seq2:1292-2407(-)